MRVYLTGATGFIGARLVLELLAAGHEVTGLARSDAGVRQLEQAGAKPHRGTLEDVESVAAGARDAEAVIHTAFDHDFAHFVENCKKDARVIAALGKALAGSDRPFIITSGVGLGTPPGGGLAVESGFDRDHPIPRRASELAGEAAMADGVSVAVVRLPQVHDPVKQGLITPAVEIARKSGVSAYTGDGTTRWPAAHVDDVARLYRLALERHEAGARWHAVAEEGVPYRAIAEAIGKGLGVPVLSLSGQEAVTHFGWLAPLVGLDMAASSAVTRERLGWDPQGPTLLEDLHAMDYSPSGAVT